MLTNICFFNHYHRGDLFTHKEFIRQIKQETNIKLFYYHYNHPKVNKDLEIPIVKVDGINNNKQFYLTKDSLLINTWIGAYPEIFNKYEGVNLQSLTDSWAIIFSEINKHFNTKLNLKEFTEDYLPEIDFSFFDVSKVDDFINLTSDKKKVLICNGLPMSNQSFSSDLKDEIEYFAKKYQDIIFICTKNFNTNTKNIYFTDDIIQDTEEYYLSAPWHDRPLNTCDLNEISYLSNFCSILIGKNSGPFVFCETKKNLMDVNKTIISFSKGPKESMSNLVHLKCKYILETNHNTSSIVSAIEKELQYL